MTDPERFTMDEVLRLAISGAAKIDLFGPRGTTLCTMREIEAMAVVIAASGVLPGCATDPERRPIYPQIEKDNR